MTDPEMTDDERLEYNERAAILEYEAHMNREEAELRAIEEVLGGGFESEMESGYETNV